MTVATVLSNPPTTVCSENRQVWDHEDEANFPKHPLSSPSTVQLCTIRTGCQRGAAAKCVAVHSLPSM